jgi:hypothetical protein
MSPMLVAVRQSRSQRLKSHLHDLLLPILSRLHLQHHLFVEQAVKYTPPPVVEAPKGDYLDALSGNRSGTATSGTVRYQDKVIILMLAALVSQNSEPSGSTGMRGVLDDIS